MRVKKLMVLAIPMFLELLFSILLSTIDTIMISNYYEPDVAAIGNATSVLSLLTVLFAISSVGTSIVVSQYIGKGEKDNARLVLSQGVFFNLILSLVITLVLVTCNKLMLKAIDAPSDIIDHASLYLQFISFTLPFQALTYVMSANLKANGKPYLTTIVSFVANILNVGLNYVLIYGFGPIPELGIKGAAIATMSCHILIFTADMLLTLIILKQNIFKIKLNKKIFGQIFKLGGPSAFESVMYNISQFIVVAQVNKLLTETITARTYIMTVLSYTMIISSAFGNANAILVGYEVGKKDYKEAKKYTLTTSLIAIPIIISVVIGINISGKYLFGIFTNNTDIINIILPVLPYLFILEIGRCTNLIVINALKSAGDAIFPLILGIICMMVVAAFGSYLLSDVLGLGLIGIFLAIGLDEAIRGIVATIRWNTPHWQNKGI